ncbi:MAG: type II secretion system protein [Candidatus Omnitrophica bacterium]|nr:type II secretion system protein [Candidatus Omnitrophota bacterium]
MPSRFNKRYFARGFTLVEMIVVAVIIGILVTFAAPQFIKTKERTLDKDAQANLSLIQSGERIYRMEQGVYYPALGTSTSVVADINTNLKVSLPVSSTSWSYTLTNTAGSETAKGTRVGAGGRIWTINLAPGSSDVAVCTGTGCP